MTPAELLVLSIALGIVVSFIFSEVYGLAAGGVVVPGYVALYLDRPVLVGVTLLVALVTYLAVVLLSQMVIVYGRRRTSLTILIAFSLGAWLGQADALSNWFGLDEGETAVIGYIIPGLVAIWFDRQGVVATTASLAIGACLVRLLLLLLIGPLEAAMPDGGF